MENIYVIARDLPALTTTTTTSSLNSTTTASSTYSESGSASYTSTSGNSTVTETYSTPVITPPSIEGNRNIWITNRAPGTVFIAVGSVAGVILLLLLLWYFVVTWVSYRQAKQIREYNKIERQFQNPFLDEGAYKGGLFSMDDEDRTSSSVSYPLKSASSNGALQGQNRRMSHSMIRLLGGSTDELLQSQGTRIDSNLSSSPVEKANVFDHVGADRRSLYISPTLEVMNKQRKSALFSNLNQSVASFPESDGEELSSTSTPQRLDKPGRTVSPVKRDKYHSKKSSLSQVVNASTTDLDAPNDSISTARNKKHRHTKTPSMFLDDLLES